jgi:histidinol-phosphatase
VQDKTRRQHLDELASDELASDELPDLSNPETTISPDLAFAHRLADATDAIALRHFVAGDTAWRAKSDGSPVSIADEQVERTLRTLILRDRPGDAVLGEEFGATGQSRRRWIIDAIDGTASFLAGEPEWSTLIALEDQGVIALGLVTAPALQRRWWAARGTGAWTRSTARTEPATVEPLVITGSARLGEASIGIWPPPPRLGPAHTAIAARLAATAGATRPVLNWADPAPSSDPIRKPSTGTGTCHGALLVATGQLDAFLLLGAGPWDVAPLVPIIEEAGGSYTDLTTTPSAGTASALFTNPALRQQILNATNHRF